MRGVVNPSALHALDTDSFRQLECAVLAEKDVGVSQQAPLVSKILLRCN